MIYLKVMDKEGEIEISELTFEGRHQIIYEAEELIKQLQEMQDQE